MITAEEIREQTPDTTWGAIEYLLELFRRHNVDVIENTYCLSISVKTFLNQSVNWREYDIGLCDLWDAEFIAEILKKEGIDKWYNHA